MTGRVLRWLAGLLLCAALVLWLAKGANRGWTKTHVPVPRTDEVTGITVNDYPAHFVPGVDFLAAAVLGSGVLAAASFLFQKRQPQNAQ